VLDCSSCSRAPVAVQQHVQGCDAGSKVPRAGRCEDRFCSEPCIELLQPLCRDACLNHLFPTAQEGWVSCTVAACQPQYSCQPGRQPGSLEGLLGSLGVRNAGRWPVDAVQLSEMRQLLVIHSDPPAATAQSSSWHGGNRSAGSRHSVMTTSHQWASGTPSGQMQMALAGTNSMAAYLSNLPTASTCCPVVRSRAALAFGSFSTAALGSALSCSAALAVSSAAVPEECCARCSPKPSSATAAC